MILDKELIKDFRNKINYSNYIYNKYENIKDKNKWHCICSSMDWIDISVDFINSEWNSSDNINIKCMNLFAYISSINVLWEAIEQLHRVFYNNNKKPFKGQKENFKNGINEEDDNDYFKTIRACFGAHPVNLKDPNNDNNRRFASWPFERKFSWHKDDFYVKLYSNQVDAEDIYLGINIDELNAFALQRYEYLKDIMKEIDRQYKAFLKKYKNEEIPKCEDIIEQLSILKLESEKRLNDDYYNNLIDELICIYTVAPIKSTNKDILDNYKFVLKNVVDEIYDKLQNMQFQELENDKIINPKVPSELSYSFQKLSSAMWSGNELYAFDQIEKFLENIVDFNEIESIDELYVLTLAGFYIKDSKVNM